jgi:hypothetical protein
MLSYLKGVFINVTVSKLLNDITYRTITYWKWAGSYYLGTGEGSIAIVK